MRFLGLDLGTKTLGISVSDLTNTIASPVETIRFEEGIYEVLLSQINELVEELNVGNIVLGFPKNMNNTIGPRGEETIEFKNLLEDYLNIPVILQDERRSTIAANNYMLEGNVSRKKRKQKIDTLAAVIILQTYLDKEKGR